jgi:hypothetical protein
MLGPITQDPAYHHFADARALLGIPNGADTLSNAAFLLVGAAGLLFVWRRRFEELRAYQVLFGAVMATAFGSAYYHLAPDDARLVWDRLPMAVGFMALVAAVIGERIGPVLGRRLLLPLVACGLASVVYWAVAADLRPYLLTQYGSIAFVIVLASVCRSRYTQGWVIFLAVGIYVLAKACEAYDRQIYALTAEAVSGHTLKHLLAAAALYAILRSLGRRSLRPLVDHPLRLADGALH